MSPLPSFPVIARHHHFPGLEGVFLRDRQWEKRLIHTVSSVFCPVETGMNGGSHPNYEKRYLFAWGGSPVQGLDTARWGKLLDMI